MPRAHSMSLNAQFGGGFNGGETAFAHLYVRLVNEACRHAKRTCANLFLDVISAFASLLRCIVFDCEDGDEARFSKLTQHGFSEADILSIVDSVRKCANWKCDNEGNISEPQHREAYDLSYSLAKT